MRLGPIGLHRCLCVFVVVWAGLVTNLDAAGPGPATQPVPALSEQLAVIDAIAPSACRVEFTYRYDKGQSPAAVSWRDYCPSCGRSHSSSTDLVLYDDRPMELPAYVLSPTQILAPDIGVHPRFITKVEVRCGEQVVPAKVAGIYREQEAALMELDKPLVNAKPLRFDAAAKGPLFSVKYSELNGQWTLSARPAERGTALASEDGRKFQTIDIDVLIADKTGAAVGALYGHALPLDDSWKGDPARWSMIKATEMAEMLSRCETRSAACIHRVVLSFRSPKTGGGAARDGYGAAAAEQETLGVLMNDKTVLVIGDLPPALTARLTGISIRPEGGSPVTAHFAGSLEDYGGFLAKLDAPLKGAATLSTRKVLDFRDAILIRADVQLRGEKRIAYFQHARVRGFYQAWKKQMFMYVHPAGVGSFMFDLDGSLVGLPLARRQKLSVEAADGPPAAQLMPVAHLVKILAEPQRYVDASNAPLSEEEENRTAWMGVELQPLNRELARAQGVSDLTFDGVTGGLVSYVYPNSPAAEAGIEAGDVLIRLHVPDQPRPVEIQVEPYAFADKPFPWDRLAACPEEYFDRLPPPWLPIGTVLSHTLTELAYGKPYTLEYVHAGKVLRKEMKVVRCPTHFDAAPRHRDARLGLTVRNLTFESRRYFHKADDDPGVILSKIDMGGAASKAGLRPYELVTHVNGDPVRTADDFKRAVEGQTELRLDVKQIIKGRLVKMVVAAPATRPATQPTTEPSQASKDG